MSEEIENISLNANGDVDNGDLVTPWVVKSEGEKGIDYDKLIGKTQLCKFNLNITRLLILLLYFQISKYSLFLNFQISCDVHNYKTKHMLLICCIILTVKQINHINAFYFSYLEIEVMFLC